MEDTAQYRDFYLQTANDYLISLKAALNVLQQNPTDQAAQNEMHIAWHSLKSQSDFMGYKSTALFCHVLELFFYSVLHQQTQIASDSILLIEQAVKMLENSLNNIKTAGSEIDFTAEINNFKEKLGVSI